MTNGFFERLKQRFGSGPPDLGELEQALFEADLGVPFVSALLEQFERAPRNATAEELLERARDAVAERLVPRSLIIPPEGDPPFTILICGVNGAGKTSAAGKLAARLVKEKRKVMLAAADTFRAGAIEQLAIWGARTGADVASASYGADPAAVVHDAWQKARATGVGVLIVDTAGRLHTRDNLMAQLAKMKRTLAKLDPAAPHEVLLVVDATTGGNAVIQAREFHAIAGLTGLIMTKLDGSGGGGALVAIAEETGVPPMFAGVGEEPGDFLPFETRRFVDEML